MPRRSRTRLISQKKVRNASADPRPHGDMTFPEPGPRVTGSAWVNGVES